MTHANRLDAVAPDWDSDDAENLRKFFDTQTGQRLLDRFDWERPDFGVTGDTTERLAVAGRIEGYELALRIFVSLSRNIPVVTEPPEQYPDLDDASKWKSLGLDK